MYPKKLVLKDFIYNDPKFIVAPILFQERDNIYSYGGILTMHQLTIGAVFVNEARAYKIISREKNIKEISLQFLDSLLTTNHPYTQVIVQEYVDDHVEKFLSRLRTIKAALAVCSDAVEEQGCVSLATELRNHIDKLSIKDLD